MPCWRWTRKFSAHREGNLTNILYRRWCIQARLTTLAYAAVISRVAAAIPIVIDVLNVDTFMRQITRQRPHYGFWAKAVRPPLQPHHLSLTSFGTPEMAFMLKNEDRSFFRKRLTMPVRDQCIG